MAYRPSQYRPMKSGFMEPISRSPYYEDVFQTPMSKQIDDDPETYSFDLCESSNDEEKLKDKAVTPLKRIPSGHTMSRGTIRRPKYKCRTTQETDTSSTFIENTSGPSVMAKQHVQLKIAPGRNSKHSIDLTSEDPEEHDPTKPTHEPHLNTRAATEDFTGQARSLLGTTPSLLAEKAQQQQLAGAERFEQTCMQRRAIREQRQKACEKARKIKDRARRDVEIAEACLVDEAPMSPKGFCVFVPKSEIFTDFVDCTRPKARGRPGNSKQKSKTKSPMKNGEERR